MTVGVSLPSSMFFFAFVDLCERSLARMNNEEIGGCLLGISSPGVTSHYYGPDPSYSMPGSGKTLMEVSLSLILFYHHFVTQLINASDRILL